MKPRGPYPPILRQKLPWPADGKPVRGEITAILLEIHERIAALSEYYGVQIGTPEWDELWPKRKKRFEGFRLKRYRGLTAAPEQAYKDLVLVYWVEVEGDTPTEMAERLAARWAEDERKLRTRYYKLTRPKTDEDQRARVRMAKLAAELLDSYRE